MPAVAKKSGASSVRATDGARGSSCAKGRWNWNIGTTQYSDQGSSNVFAENIGVVRQNDTMISHPNGTPCVSSPVNHAPGLSTYSPNVFANGLPIGRIGDLYDSDRNFSHAITSGAASVFANSGSGLVVAGGDAVYSGPAGSSEFVTIGGGTPNTGVTSRVPPNPAPGEPYTVTITGVPDGPVTYTNPQTGQVETVMAVNGVVSVGLVAPSAVVGQTSEQAISFEFTDGTVNGGSLIVIPDLVTTAANQFQAENPTTWREIFREEYFKSIGGDPGDGIIVTNPGEFGPGQFWYDYLLENVVDSSTGA